MSTPTCHPYMDPLLRASRGLLKELIFALQEVGLIAYRRAVKAFIGLSTVIKKGWSSSAPHRGRPAAELLASASPVFAARDQGAAANMDVSHAAIGAGMKGLQMCGASVDFQDGFYQFRYVPPDVCLVRYRLQDDRGGGWGRSRGRHELRARGMGAGRPAGVGLPVLLRHGHGLVLGALPVPCIRHSQMGSSRPRRASRRSTSSWRGLSSFEIGNRVRGWRRGAVS